ncbi:hypothetical protein [Stieleria varia]|uniref:Uncharacterized protein n=1 Tax=Stieleria varia TaxID=2528005 RepID=A0A5C6AX79_9BACT|nr:hypothetical protein [Stieleria varia]TWU04238.1 hypothetical protein Pla52n_22770 [Stieleria varia]
MFRRFLSVFPIFLGVCFVPTGVFFQPAFADTSVNKISHASLGDGPLHLYVGKVSLPADGLWTPLVPSLPDADSQNTLRELYLVPTDKARLRDLGKRMYAALQQSSVQNGRWQVRMGYEACRQFAEDHDGVGPADFADFANEKRWEHVAKNWDALNLRNNELLDAIDHQQLVGPFLHLIPAAKFKFSEPDANLQRNGVTRQIVPQDKRVVLAFELRPLIDDGKHWVLYTDGNCERIDVDPELIAAQKVTIRPILDKDAAKVAAEKDFVDYMMVVVSSRAMDAPLSLNIHNQVLGQNEKVSLNIPQAADVPYAQLSGNLSDARNFAWQPYLKASRGGVLHVWNQAGAPRQTPDARRNLSMFSVLGGRAAIEETLQLQDLAVTRSDEAQTVEIDSLKGVEVTSHPFEAMLGGAQGGSLEMARYVPADRLFVYIGKPESIPAMLDKGAPFIASLGTSLTRNCLQYNLESRYLSRLGMTRDWVDTVLASGLTSEMALFAPDLFFIDGTDVTVVAKLRQPELLRQLLGLLGASKLEGNAILEIPTTSDAPAYMALRDDLLFASTQRGEIELAIGLHEQQGHDSLGDSAEFRYMLTQLDVSEQTRIYAYLSDPFIRRLVSPQVKLAQRRRMIEKAKLEAMTASVLLARLNGEAESISTSTLIDEGLLPKNWKGEGMSVEATGLVRSERYGSLPRMRTLPEVPVEKATEAEAEAYRMYVENYSNYWRRFFDPIAIRLDEVESNQLELSTFILPLVDNSIYNGLRTMLAHQDDNVPLSIPVVEPKPVLQFSMNLKEAAWQQIAGNFSEFFQRFSGASPAMMDDFGPSIHVAIFDADPIIAMGSGDIFGAFGGDVLRGGGNQMLMVPVMLSMLTRPCSIMVETKSPEQTAQYLRQAALSKTVGGNRNDFAVSFYQVDDRDEWVWTMDIFGVVKLRYGVEVHGNYMVIRNIPWSSDDQVINVEPAQLNAAMLQANPSACQRQLPGLFAAASDGNRQAVMSGLGRLYPFMLSGSKNVEQAAAEHQRLFGFYPRQLPGDQWLWENHQLVSKQYGKPSQQRQPAFDPEKPFGLMNRIDTLQLNMQFEEDGLRSTIRWGLR